MLLRGYDYKSYSLLNTVICMNSQLTVVFGRYEEHVLYSTPCGKYVDAIEICDAACNSCTDCIAGENFLSEIGIEY